CCFEVNIKHSRKRQSTSTMSLQLIVWRKLMTEQETQLLQSLMDRMATLEARMAELEAQISAIPMDRIAALDAELAEMVATKVVGALDHSIYGNVIAAKT